MFDMFKYEYIFIIIIIKIEIQALQNHKRSEM